MVVLTEVLLGSIKGKPFPVTEKPRLQSLTPCITPPGHWPGTASDRQQRAKSLLSHLNRACVLGQGTALQVSDPGGGPGMGREVH